MTIYTEITKNKAKSYLILFIFIFLISGFFYLVGQYYGNSEGYLIMGLLFSSLSGIGSYFYSDKIVLMTTGARPAERNKHFDFYTAAENLSIASGLPMPKLYVINDPAPNAFATGRDPKHAVVCVTTGLLDKLERTELEGVIAHELSHIKNYDILLSSLVAVLVGTVALASDWIMRGFWRGGRKSGSKAGRNPVMLVFFIIALILAPVTATIIQLAVSRKREFLADADGALLTRYPNGLARALEKIAADPVPLRSVSPATAHIFISNPLKKRQGGSWLSTLFSTHPPVDERIKILRSM